MAENPTIKAETIFCADIRDTDAYIVHTRIATVLLGFATASIIYIITHVAQALETFGCGEKETKEATGGDMGGGSEG